MGVSDYERPEKLVDAPDVSKSALQQKINRLAATSVITYLKEDTYLIPRNPEPPASDEQT